MLRAIVRKRKTVGELRLSDEPCIKSIVGKGKSTEEFDDWEDPVTFTKALEKVEAWIFSRIVESVWWQIGNWSRWLTDLFGIEDNDSHEDNDTLGDYKGVETDTFISVLFRTAEEPEHGEFLPGKITQVPSGDGQVLGEANQAEYRKMVEKLYKPVT
ncbi:hypothetical protein POM88_044928 [Heracleum sosnowskyi]|uniref:Uncharacterized protein n=1 Tax=Heracleum sosnowskyi TaxID=360622 RepID=A0AAD8M5M5_9APIA|nr:hypothetical protein POM88_044928 [Heracleum sosnowskyi]